MERSHYSYKHNNEAVFVGFKNKARVKTAHKPEKQFSCTGRCKYPWDVPS